jgi:hypothetical protein
MWNAGTPFGESVQFFFLKHGVKLYTADMLVDDSSVLVVQTAACRAVYKQLCSRKGVLSACNVLCES